MAAAAAAPSGRLALLRLVLMSWAWNFLADCLWIPVVAYLADLGYEGGAHAALLFALNLGSRLLPNLAVALLGMKAEFAMMACVVLGDLLALAFPGQLWALYAMAFCSGMGFVRACLSLHPAMVYSDAAELARAAKYCGAARNFGTLTALVVPVYAYKLFGWGGVCAADAAAALLYMGLAAVQHFLYGGEGGPAAAGGADVESPRSREGAGQPIPWILWVLGAAFVTLELQMNICNAAVPTAFVHSFGLDIGSAGHIMALTNGASMCFLAWLPSAPACLRCLHRSPMNILLAYSVIFAAWCLALLATAPAPEPRSSSGLLLFLPGVLLFMLAAYMAQCLTLECLTGVLDLEGSKALMAVSETVGCGFAAFGGYAGGALRDYGAAAPFALQALTALLAVLTLALSLGHRLETQLALCGPKQPPARSRSAGWLRRSLSGLQAMGGESCGESFVASEREYLRRSWSAGLGESLLAGADASTSAGSSAGSSPCSEGASEDEGEARAALFSAAPAAAI